MTAAIDLDLSVAPDAIAEARAAIDRISGNPSATLRNNLRLLVSELVTNSVRHGRLADDAVISLHIESRPDAVRVEVTNPGDGFLPPDRALTLDQESGWGLFLVDELADRWGIDADGGTHVWFEIDR